MGVRPEIKATMQDACSCFNLSEIVGRRTPSAGEFVASSRLYDALLSQLKHRSFPDSTWGMTPNFRSWPAAAAGDWPNGAGRKDLYAQWRPKVYTAASAPNSQYARDWRRVLSYRVSLRPIGKLQVLRVERR